MKKDILLIAHFCCDFDEKGNNRFNYLAELISDNNFDLEFITSSFSHSRKMSRDIKLEALNYKITYIHEPHYNKNVSFKRFYSHYIMAINFKKYLKKRKKPDIIYCAVPSLDVAKVAAKYAKMNNIKFIIDIQDLWPEAFKMIFNIPVLSNIVFYPMKKQADYIYKVANEVVAVSKTYLNRSSSVRKSEDKNHIIFLGTKLKEFDKLSKENIFLNKPQGEFWLAYIGTLGNSYDLLTVIDALKILIDKGITNIKFIVMGDGPLKEKFQQYASKQEISVCFMGKVEYGKMVGILKACDVAVNPIKSKSAGSIINKVADYAAAGLPVLNTQDSEEYKNLIDYYKIGINCKNESSHDFADKLLKLYEDKELRELMGKNNRELAHDKFDREKTYGEILSLL